MKIKHLFAWIFAIAVVVGAGYVMVDNNTLGLKEDIREITVKESESAIKKTFTQRQLESIRESPVSTTELKGLKTSAPVSKTYARKDFLELVSNTDNCWTDCKTVYKIANPTDYDIQLTDDSFGLEFVQFKRKLEVDNTRVLILKNISKYVPNVIIDYVNYTERAVYSDGKNGTRIVEWTDTRRVETVDGLKEIITEEFVPVTDKDVIKSGEETRIEVRGSIPVGHGADNVITYAGIRNFEFAEWWANAHWIYAVNFSVGDAIEKNVTTLIANIDASNTTIFNSSSNIYVGVFNGSNATKIHSEVSGYATSSMNVYWLNQEDYANNTNIFNNITIFVGQLGDILSNRKYIMLDGTNLSSLDGYTGNDGNKSEFIQYKVNSSTEYARLVTFNGRNYIQTHSRDGTIDDAGCWYSTRNFTLDLIRYDYEVFYEQIYHSMATPSTQGSDYGIVGNAVCTGNAVATDQLAYRVPDSQNVFGYSISNSSTHIAGTVGNIDLHARNYYFFNATAVDNVTYDYEALSAGNSSGVLKTTSSASFIPHGKTLRLFFKTWGNGAPDPNASTGNIGLMAFPKNRTTVLVGGGAPAFPSTDLPPEVNLINPPNATVNTSNSHVFFANATDDVALVNFSLYHDISGSWVRNQTLNRDGVFNTSNISVANIPIGDYNWNVEVCDDANNCKQASSNFTFTVQNPVSVTDPTFDPTQLFANTTASANTTYINVNGDNGTITFNWSVDQVQTFIDNRTDIANGTTLTSNFTAGNFTKGQNVSLQIVARNATTTDTEETSNVVGDIPPHATNITLPLNNTINIISSLFINYSNTTDFDNDSVSFELYADTNNPPTTLVQNSSSTTGFNLTSIAEGTNYLRVRAVSTNLTSPYSPMINFTQSTDTLLSHVHTFVTPVIENSNNSFNLNLTINNNTVGDLKVNLSYNGTIYVMTRTNISETEFQFIAYATTPIVSATTNVTFGYNITSILFNGTIETNNSITTFGQQVTPITPLSVGTSCSAGLSAAMCWDFAKETDLTSITADKVEYNFQFGITNTTAKLSNGTLTNVANFCACINSTTYNNYTMGFGEIKYYENLYTDRSYYTFSSQRLSNETVNNTLHFLNNSLATSFKIEVEDSSLNPFQNAYITLLRWYVGLNSYRVVEMARTDETGSTVLRVKTEDVDYRLGVYYQNGSLIKLANPIRMICVTTPCTYTLTVIPGETDYTSFLNIDQSLTFNNNTGIWSYVFSDDTQATNSMNLTVWKDTGTSSYIVCSTTTNGSAGAMSCNTSGFTGTLRGEVHRAASPGVLIAQKVIQTDLSPLTSGFGLWLSALVAIPLIILFAQVSPQAALFGGVIALIPAYYFGSINIGIFGGFMILAGIVAHFLKRVN